MDGLTIIGLLLATIGVAGLLLIDPRSTPARTQITLGVIGFVGVVSTAFGVIGVIAGATL